MSGGRASKRMAVPADLRRRIEEAAADMGVLPEWVLRACVEIGLQRDDDSSLALVLAVEDVMRAPRIVRMPRYRKTMRGRAAADATPATPRR